MLSANPLVTLTGAPGIGKTRLALEVSGVVAAAYRDGAAFVDLAPIADSTLVPRAVASALAIMEVAGVTLSEALVGHLRGRSLLLVLDNCEHLAGTCARLVELLLRSCSELRILATSRQPLAVTGERVWPVPPLSVPPAGVELPEILMGCAAVRLFVERARTVQAEFALNAYVAPAVAEVCRRLDGLPLGIELAAARVETLTPAEIARRLDDRFSLLGGPGEPPRHGTLEAALDWSHELLSEPERTLLRRLSVFVGSIDLAAAQAVCAGEGVEAAEVPELLGRLAARSLLVPGDRSASGVRCRLLETVRAYAGDRLEEGGETATLRERHARHYLLLAERAEPELTGPRQKRWLDRLEAEHENLRLALEWSLSHGHAEWALRLAGALVLFWRVHCHFTEGRDLLDAVVSASARERPGLRAKALWGAGFMTLMAGDPERATPVLEQSLACFRELGDRRGCARALLILGNSRQPLGDPRVLALFEESAALARETGDSWCLAHALAVAGFEYMRFSELTAARPLFEHCLAVARKAEDAQGLRFGLWGLGSVALGQGDHRLAESLLEEAMTVADELAEDYVRSSVLTRLGELALRRGDYDRARQLLDEALALLPEPAPFGAVLDPLLMLARVAHAQGDRRRAHVLLDEVLHRAGAGRTSIPAVQLVGELALDEGDVGHARRRFEEALELARAGRNDRLAAEALHGLGQLARGDGEPDRAAALHGEALELRRRLGEAPGIVASVEAVAGLAAAAGRHPCAARLLGAAQQLRDRRGYARAPWESVPHEADVALARQGLCAPELEAAWAEGAALSIDEAVAEAAKGPGRSAQGWASLTGSEQEVATLVAEGLTNAQVAERLFVSLGTVKAHLSHAFAKLGVARRSELSREVWRHRR